MLSVAPEYGYRGRLTMLACGFRDLSVHSVENF